MFRKKLTASDISTPVEYLVIQPSVQKFSEGASAVSGYIPRQVVEQEIGVTLHRNERGDLCHWFNREQSQAIHAHPLFVTHEQWDRAALQDGK